MTSEITLTAVEQETLAMIVCNPGIVISGGKSQKSKKYQRMLATYTLVNKGLITVKHNFGYKTCNATPEGVKLANVEKYVSPMSRKQIVRQQTRKNGKYEEYLTCDCCNKKFMQDELSYDEYKECVVCPNCLSSEYK